MKGVGWLIAFSVLTGAAWGLSIPPAKADIVDVYVDLQNNGVPIASYEGVAAEAAQVCHLLRSGADPLAVVGGMAQGDGITNREAAIGMISFVRNVCPDTMPAVNAAIHRKLV